MFHTNPETKWQYSEALTGARNDLIFSPQNRQWYWFLIWSILTSNQRLVLTICAEGRPAARSPPHSDSWKRYFPEKIKPVFISLHIAISVIIILNYFRYLSAYNGGLMLRTLGSSCPLHFLLVSALDFRSLDVMSHWKNSPCRIAI